MKFDKALKQFLIREPFYGLFFTNVLKTETDKVETLGVRIKGTFYELLWNPTFWDTLTDNEQIAVLKHECLHIIYKHLIFYNDLTNKRIANIAMDAEINLHIDHLPEGCIDSHQWKVMYPDYEMEQGTRYNYKFLLEHANESPMGGGSSQGGQSGQGNQNGQGDQGDGSDQYGRFGKQFDSHEFEEQSDELTDGQKTVLDNQVNRILYETYLNNNSQLPGDVPAGIKEAIDNFGKLKPPVFNWKNYLRNLLGQAEEYFAKSTRKRPSKRFLDSPGRRHIHKSNILVAIDTSGSVSRKDIEDAFSEIYHVWRAGATVDVIDFDTECYGPKRYNGHMFEDVEGRGGTDFDAPIKFFNERRYYDQLVIITDGYASWSINPRFNKCVWIVSESEQNYPGIVVYTNKDN